jgi:hypothetical protein
MKVSTAIFGWLLLGTIGTLATIVAVRSILRGEYPTAVVALGGSAFCYGLIAPLAKVVRRKQAPRAEVDDVGTTFRPDPGIDIPVQVSLVGSVVASALILILVPLGKLDVPIPSFMRYSLPLMCGVILIIGAPMLWRNVSRGGTTKYLRLTPNGFELSEGWRSQSGDWDQVRNIVAENPAQQTSTPAAIVFVMSDETAPTISAGAMTPDGIAVRELVRFYWQHADHRDELTDGRALERLNALDRR